MRIPTSGVALLAIALALVMTPVYADHDGQTQTNGIANGAVTTPKLRNGAVTPAKIRANAVTTPKIRDNAVTTSKIGDAAVTGDKVAANTLTGTHIDETSLAVWLSGGNANTTAGTHFVGTTDNEPLEFHVNNSRALRLEPNNTTPNLIGGHNGNQVTAGAIGATIGGGGNTPNQVTDNFGTVGGGEGNQAGNADSNPLIAPHATVAGGRSNTASGLRATVGGGMSNTASSQEATVGGGGGNTASNNLATVGGGSGNTASNNAATVGGGQDNTASGGWTTVGGGATNTASGLVATVGGGQENTASGDWTTVGGGFSNTASNNLATVGGGSSNSASGFFATVPGGLQAHASRWGELAHAGGTFTTNVAGTAQASQFVLRHVTNTANPTRTLFLNGSSIRLVLADGQTLAFEGLVSARASNGNSAGYRIEGVIKRVGGTTSLVGTPSVVTMAEDVTDWDVAVVANNATNALDINVTGSAPDDVRWVATIRTSQVVF